MKTKIAPTTMQIVWGALSAEDRAICLSCLIHKTEFKHVHMGMLPFVPVAAVLGAIALRNVNWDKDHRPSRRLNELFNRINKMTLPSEKSPPLYLLDAKVYKHFGPHPERGRRFNFLGKKRVTVGVKWSLPKQEHIPDDDVHVTPCVALRRHSKCRWILECEATHREKVTEWLVDNLR